jgi:uncharacterized protein
VFYVSTLVLSPLAVGSIRLYQRFISPHKGFRCANRAATQGWSCSEFGRRVFARYEISTAYALLQRRFAACKQSYATLRAARVAANLSANMPANLADAASAVPGPQHERDKKQHKTSQNSDCSCDLPSIDVCAAADIGACDCSF